MNATDTQPDAPPLADRVNDLNPIHPAPTGMQPAPEPRTWTFDLIPEPSHETPLPVRVASAVADAMARGLVVQVVRIVLVGDSACDAPSACRVRKFLKRTGRRGHGLRARWPEPEVQ